MRVSRKTLITLLLVMSGMTLMGLPAYSDFYQDFISRLSSVNPVNWEKITSFCGWTGQAYPGESIWAYRIRGAWNMISANMAMTALSLFSFVLFYYAVHFIFKMTDRQHP